MKTLSKKMLGYALGRTVLASDQPLIAGMMAAGGNASFSDLAVKIVSSRQFRNRSGDDEIPKAGPGPLKTTNPASASQSSQLRTGIR